MCKNNIEELHSAMLRGEIGGYRSILGNPFKLRFDSIDSGDCSALKKTMRFL